MMTYLEVLTQKTYPNPVSTQVLNCRSWSATAIEKERNYIIISRRIRESGCNLSYRL